MAGQSGRSNSTPPGALSAPGGEVSLQDLFDQLVEHATRAECAGPTEGEIVFELERNGLRCTVVRVGANGANEPMLSPREREIARMVAIGYPNKTIATVLEISQWTVATHLRRMFVKLGVTSRAAMVARLSTKNH